MFDTQQEAIEYALDSRPRGMEIGDKVCYADRAFEVLALQQWAFREGAHTVGLVWAGFCANCGIGWHQLTETRVSRLEDVCGRCSAAAPQDPRTHDETVGANLIFGTYVHNGGAKTGRGVVRYGANERHVLDVIEREFGDVESADEVAFIAHCAELLPARDDGRRDQRIFLMRRALQSLAKRKDGPVVVVKGRVIFCK